MMTDAMTDNNIPLWSTPPGCRRPPKLNRLRLQPLVADSIHETTDFGYFFTDDVADQTLADNQHRDQRGQFVGGHP